MFCSLYVFESFPDSSTFPSEPFFLLECMYLFTLFDQITYFGYIVGKSIPFLIVLEFLVSSNSPIFRGYALFLVVTEHSIFIIKIYRKIQSYLSSKWAYFCTKCQVLYVYFPALFLLSSLALFPLVVDTSSITMIPVTSLWLSHVYSEKSIHSVSVSASWSLDEVLLPYRIVGSIIAFLILISQLLWNLLFCTAFWWSP